MNHQPAAGTRPHSWRATGLVNMARAGKLLPSHALHENIFGGIKSVPVLKILPSELRALEHGHTMERAVMLVKDWMGSVWGWDQSRVGGKDLI